MLGFYAVMIRHCILMCVYIFLYCERHHIWSISLCISFDKF